MNTYRNNPDGDDATREEAKTVFQAYSDWLTYRDPIDKARLRDNGRDECVRCGLPEGECDCDEFMNGL